MVDTNLKKRKRNEVVDLFCTVVLLPRDLCLELHPIFIVCILLIVLYYSV